LRFTFERALKGERVRAALYVPYMRKGERERRNRNKRDECSELTEERVETRKKKVKG
jgi:hypothetical protein